MAHKDIATCILAAAAIALASPAMAANPDSKTEVGFARGALGYEALMNGRNDQAVKQIEARGTDTRNPAKLINLATAYARTGDRIRARSLLQAAIASPDQFDIVLADGRVMNSRAAAALALAGLGKSQTAAR